MFDRGRRISLLSKARRAQHDGFAILFDSNGAEGTRGGSLHPVDLVDQRFGFDSWGNEM